MPASRPAGDTGGADPAVTEILAAYAAGQAAVVAHVAAHELGAAAYAIKAAWAAATEAARVDVVTAKGAPKLEQLAASGIEHEVIDLSLDDIFEAFVIGRPQSWPRPLATVSVSM